MKGIEIPFGAKDSELCGWEYTIPEGMEAVVENGKVIVRRMESEDERIRKGIIDYLSNELHNVKQLTPRTNEFKAWIAYLEKQKEPLTPTESYMKGFSEGVEAQKEVEQKPAEWSEEDIEMYAKVLFCFQSLTFPADEERHKTMSWLKSFINRGNSPKSNTNSSSWKPSEEQMEALKEAIYLLDGSEYSNGIDSLYNDLNKLK